MNRILTARSLNVFMRTENFHIKQSLQSMFRFFGTSSINSSISHPNNKSNNDSVKKQSKDNHVISVSNLSSLIPMIKIERENLPFQKTHNETILNKNDMTFMGTDLDSITTDELEKLKIMCKDYTDPTYVFKRCNTNFNRNKFLVIMQKLTTTDTNEQRFNVVDSKYAKFKADKLLVKRIIHLPTLTDYNNILHRFPDGSAEYTVNSIIIDDMCDNKINVHYYKTLQGAYFGSYYPLGYYGTPGGYTGLWFKCNDNGEKTWIIEFKQGIEIRSVLWMRYNYYIYKTFCKQFHKRYMKELTDGDGIQTKEVVAGTIFKLYNNNEILRVNQYCEE